MILIFLFLIGSSLLSTLLDCGNFFSTPLKSLISAAAAPIPLINLPIYEALLILPSLYNIKLI
jgi:hypothetical protein